MTCVGETVGFVSKACERVRYWKGKAEAKYGRAFFYHQKKVQFYPRQRPLEALEIFGEAERKQHIFF